MSKFAVLASWSLVLLFGCDSYAPTTQENGIFAACCSGTGTCVPRASVKGDDASKLSQDTCDSALLCVPTGLAESEQYIAPTCRSFGLSEGRCLPACLPEIAKQAERLQRDECAEGNLCVPCFDPVTSEDSGACSLGGDQGAAEPPRPFDNCCEGRGRCIPEGIIEDDKRKNLAADSCDLSTQTLCVPEVWVSDLSAKPSTCRAYGDSEGRCLSECLGEVASRGDQLRSEGCEPNHRCVPCFDPISGEPSDACTLAGDAPTEPAKLFEGCCGDVGACVPTEAVSDGDRARLAQDSCKQAETLCVPRDWVKLDRKPPTSCSAYGDAEGRCLARCLPEVSKQEDRLRKDLCADTELCVPCFDPLTGEDTGACKIGNDPGPVQEPLVFGNCCGARGRCVPSDAVDKSSRDELDAKGCEDTDGALCVPSAWVEDPHHKPSTCSAYGDAEGRCLPECLPEVAMRVGKLRQDSCELGERCVPCFDPLTGEQSGACGVNGDKAKEPAHLFSNCCGSLGACVPQDALEPDDRARLDGSECGGPETALCAPKAWIKDDRTVPDSCRAYGDIEARCLPSCLPGVVARADKLQRETCATDHLCVPCFDPVTLESTRACNIGADLPKELPKPFADCCDGIGRCVPQTLVSEPDRGRLSTDSCDQGEPRLCVPEAWVQSDRFVPASCTAPGQLEGRCLPGCLPDVMKRADQLTVSGCAAQHLCVPCYDPVTGEDTNACHVGQDKPPAQPTLFAECCGGAGVCVPSEQVASEDRSRLGVDSCGARSQSLCAPRNWVGASRTKPQTCSSFDGAEGRCMPSCLPEVAAKAADLRQDTCPATNLCVPCYDPVDGEDTQACHIAGDAPTRPAQLFSNCCGDLGRCIPSTLVPTENRSELAADSCNAADHLCAPTEWLGDERSAALTCHGWVGGEGRCLPNCLPGVAAQNGRLVQDVCGANRSCAPCFDPVTSAATGACTQPGDTGPAEKKQVFETCCHGGARCVPSAAIDPGDRNRLGKVDCDNPLDALCVPTEWLQAERTTPVQCRAPGDIEGRCLSSCLPEVAARTDQLARTTCASAQLCVPCFSPLDGSATGACTTMGDVPREPAKIYQSCCGAAGTCVPGDLLDGTGSLNHESCADPESYCVPYAAPRGQDPGFAACTGGLFGHGACVNSCFIDDGARGFLSRDRCQSGELCVSCGSLDVETAVCD